MKEISYKDMKFNPFNLIGDEWMLVTAGNKQSGCNTMTASWGHLGCLWGTQRPDGCDLPTPITLYEEVCGQ